MARILFTDPTDSFEHDDEHLAEGIFSLFRKARHSIHIHGFSLTGFYDEQTFDKPILDALNRNVELKVFGDKKDQVNFIKSVYRDYNVQCYYFNRHNTKSLYHIKAIIIDDLYIYVGSANLSNNALYNSAELGLFMENRKVIDSLSRYTNHLIDTNFLVAL